MLTPDKFWNTVERENKILFMNIDFNDSPKVNCSVVVEQSLDLSIYFRDKKISQLCGNKLPDKVKNIYEVEDILQKVKESIDFSPKNTENRDHNILLLVFQLLTYIDTSNAVIQEPVKFMLEQISLLLKKKNAYQYSSWFLIFSCLLHSISPHCYKFLRSSGYIILPHPNTIKKVCSSYDLNPQAEQSKNNFLMYAKNKFTANMNYKNKFVNLMVDEVHLKAMLDYKGGNIVGTAFNNQLLATSAHCFMISSLLSNMEEVVHVAPVNKMCAERLHSMLKEIIIGLEKIGFNVMCVLTDNNAINRKCMQKFSPENELKCEYQHPADNSKPLFFMVDSVHLLKCIRNNWINQKDDQLTMKFPNFKPSDNTTVHEASFDTLRKMYYLEDGKMLKFGYGLTYKAVYPSSLERQNVKLALQVFNEDTISGLNILGKANKLYRFEDTSEFVQIILNWWSVVNVKTCFKGIRLNNTLMKPISAENFEGTNYLTSFLEWLKRWKSLHTSGSLTTETMNALMLTTECLIKFSEYCLSHLKFSYFLPGKCQTDPLENRFGKYRQLAGGQYNISLRQLFEVEQKMRIQSSLSLKIKSKAFGEIEIDELQEPSSTLSAASDIEKIENLLFNVEVSDEEIKSCNNDLPILVYVAGYCCHSVLKQLKCSCCKDIIVMDEYLNIDDKAYELIRDKSRGKLLHPQHHIVNVVVHNFLLVSKLCGDLEEIFLKARNQREVAFTLIMKAVSMFELLWEPEMCANGHTVENVCQKILWVSTNIFLNNYCKKKNAVSKQCTTKRKEKVLYKK